MEYSVLLPTDAACCPDINIENVVLLNKIGEILGEIAENTANIHRIFLFIQSFQALGFRVWRDAKISASRRFKQVNSSRVAWIGMETYKGSILPSHISWYITII